MKFCKICKVELTDDNRYKSEGNLLCKEHAKQRVADWSRRNKETFHKRMKRYHTSEKGKKAVNEASKRALKKFPEKWAARGRLRYAVKIGKIIKPEVCDYIHSVKGVEDCNGRIEAHHHMGYIGEHAYNVLWLCKVHHTEVHKIDLLDPKQKA